MTDQEIICTFMEPKPQHSIGWLRKHSKPLPEFWVIHEEIAGEWQPAILLLDTLWEVEERLTDEQWSRYEERFNQRKRIISRRCACGMEHLSRHRASPRALLHATPERKIKALAAVLRPIVEAK